MCLAAAADELTEGAPMVQSGHAPEDTTVLDLDEQPRRTPLNLILGLLSLALMAALGVAAVDHAPIALRARLGLAPDPTPGAWVADPATDVSAAEGPTALPEPRSTPAPSPTPPSREDHYWLIRPIGPSGTDWVEYSYPYGSRGDGTLRVHRGVEFINPAGTPVRAAATGRVVYSGDDSARVFGARPNYYGQLIIVELDRRLDGEPVYYLYGHLGERLVQTGDVVEAGQIIAHVGATGIATGPHLHLEVRVGRNDFGATANPELWLEPYPGKGAVAGVVLGSDGEPVPEVDLEVRRADRPNLTVRARASYPDHEVRPDPAWGENYVFADLDPGRWILLATRSGYVITTPFTVEAGRTNWLTVPVPWR